jgi:hypothetical protein
MKPFGKKYWGVFLQYHIHCAHDAIFVLFNQHLEVSQLDTRCKDDFWTQIVNSTTTFFTPSFTIMAKWYHHHPIRPKKITFSFTQASQTFNMATLDKCHISILVKLTWSVIISVYTPILLILWSDIQLQQPKNPKWIIFNFCWQTLLQISNDPGCYAGFTT